MHSSSSRDRIESTEHPGMSKMSNSDRCAPTSTTGEGTSTSASAHVLSLPPPGFHLQHNALSEDAWEEIREWLGLNLDDDNLGIAYNPSKIKRDDGCVINWEASPGDQCRPVAQFGIAKYDYIADVVVSCNQKNADIPPILKRLLLNNRNGNDGTHAAALASQEWSQCIINAYGANSSSHIPWHVDDPKFGPVILVYTFGEARPLRMRKDDGDNQEFYSAHPKHLSRYILSGESREDWQHSVPAGESWRVSITFRTLRNE